MSELPSSEDLDPSTGTDAPTPPTTTGPSSYTLSWEELVLRVVSSFTVLGWDNEVCRLLRRWRFGLVIILD